MADILSIFSLKGKNALVTGASSGIGRNLALTLAKAGANVVVAARRKDRLESLVAEIAALEGAGKAAAVVLDVGATEATIAPGLEEAWSAFEGGLHVLVNNAGVYGPTSQEPGSLTAEAIASVLSVNVRGAMLVAGIVGKKMGDSGRGGSIINISSVFAEVATQGTIIYSTSKGALSHFTKLLARDLGPSRVRVNEINPGLFTPSELTEGLVGLPAVQTFYKDKHPAGRVGDSTTDLDGALLLLASDAGAYINGTGILVDGGSRLLTMGFADFM